MRRENYNNNESLLQCSSCTLIHSGGMRIADQQCMLKGICSSLVDPRNGKSSDPQSEQLTGHEAALVQDGQPHTVLNRHSHLTHHLYYLTPLTE